MTTFVKYWTMAVMLLLLCVSPGAAQKRYDRQGVVRGQLLSLIHARYGSEYQYVEYTMFDTLISYSSRDNENVQDPYGTLKGCNLFSTYKASGDDEPNNFILGVMKNGQIIWDNAPGTSADLGGELLYAQDINNDGEVDLVFSKTDQDNLKTGNSPFLCYLYVLSWNGTQGRFTSAFGNDGESVMLGDGSCELVDKDGDGIWEIRTALPDIDLDWGDHRTSTYSYVTYGWNGSQYGLWPNVGQVAGDEYLPANRVSVGIGCSVQKTNNIYQYDYAIKSDSSSKQIVSDVYIGGLEDTTANLAPPLWQSGTSSFIGGRAFIKYSHGTYYLIHPGQTLGGFRTLSKTLPTIVSYYVQGYTLPVFGTSEQERQNILNNSVKGYTLGTRTTSVQIVSLDFLDTLSFYATRSQLLGWVKDQATANKYLGYFGSAKARLVENNVSSARTTLQQVLQDANVDSSSTLASEAYALIRYNTEYLLAQLPVSPAPGLNVKLINSTGIKLTGGSLQFYDGAWKGATNNSDGTFTVATSLKTLSLRMTYEGGSQTKTNVTVGSDVVVFQTVNAQVKLQTSLGTSMDTGTVQFYGGSWRTFGATANGIAAKELLPESYSFRVTFAGGSNDKQQDIGVNAIVLFQTVNASVQLKNSLGALMDQGMVQYYAGSWRTFGVTTNGSVTKELFPNNYSFRMTYAFGSKDLQQNIGTNPVVVFQTVNATVQLKNSQGALIDQGTVQYYAGAWRTFGSTSGGSVSKELLPISYSFRMTNEGVSNDRTQDLSTNGTVSFSTVLCTVSVKNAQSQPVNAAMISYYSTAWKQIGPTVNGQVIKELLPANLTFRMTSGTASQDKVQNLGTNGLVEFLVQ